VRIEESPEVTSSGIARYLGSRFHLYIKRDNSQKVSLRFLLANTSPSTISRRNSHAWACFNLGALETPRMCSEAGVFLSVGALRQGSNRVPRGIQPGVNASPRPNLAGKSEQRCLQTFHVWQAAFPNRSIPQRRTGTYLNPDKQPLLGH
jgi:hypothetical protein